MLTIIILILLSTSCVHAYRVNNKYLKVSVVSIKNKYSNAPLSASKQNDISNDNNDSNNRRGSKSKSTSPLKAFSLINFILGIAAASVVSFISYQSTPYETVNDIKPYIITEKKIIHGEVVKIIDGDTVRVRHLPTFLSSSSYKGSLKDHTIVVRIASIDTPETAKFGLSSQKYADAAKEYTTSKLLGKKVNIKCLGKDQYNRLLAFIKYKEGIYPFESVNDISVELLNEGLAVVYRQGGGVYGTDGIKKWDKIERIARDKKKGIWSEKNIELPSDYKKKLKKSDDSAKLNMPESTRTKFTRTGK